MVQNFLAGEVNLREGRIWTMLTCCVSQESIEHLLFNMASFFFLAPPVLRLVGPRTFFALYTGTGFITSLVSMGWKEYVNPWIDRGPRDQYGQRIQRAEYSHGASGECMRAYVHTG